jgi:uncharacterized membrane protein YedE/YeeE
MFAARCPWYVAGPLLGLLIVGLRWVGNLHLGATGAFVGVGRWLQRPRAGIDWRVLFFVGVLTGGLLSAVAAGAWHPTLSLGSLDSVVPTLPMKALLLVGAGGLMGAGARVAGGCTSGHGICGTAQGSPASFVATGTFMATAMISARLMALLVAS